MTTLEPTAAKYPWQNESKRIFRDYTTFFYAFLSFLLFLLMSEAHLHLLPKLADMYN
jgi:hypothetical protein